MDQPDTSISSKMKRFINASPKFAIHKECDIIIFKLKLSNRTESELFDIALRLYDADINEMLSTYPIGMNFKSRRMRGENELFTPFKNEFRIPAYVKNIVFRVEQLRPLENFIFSCDFEVKFDVF